MKNCKILNNLGCKDMHDVWINGKIAIKKGFEYMNFYF